MSGLAILPNENLVLLFSFDPLTWLFVTCKKFATADLLECLRHEFILTYGTTCFQPAKRGDDDDDVAKPLFLNTNHINTESVTLCKELRCLRHCAYMNLEGGVEFKVASQQLQHVRDPITALDQAELLLDQSLPDSSADRAVTACVLSSRFGLFMQLLEHARTDIDAPGRLVTAFAKQVTLFGSFAFAKLIVQKMRHQERVTFFNALCAGSVSLVRLCYLFPLTLNKTTQPCIDREALSLFVHAARIFRRADIWCWLLTTQVEKLARQEFHNLAQTCFTKQWEPTRAGPKNSEPKSVELALTQTKFLRRILTPQLSEFLFTCPKVPNSANGVWTAWRLIAWVLCPYAPQLQVSFFELSSGFDPLLCFDLMPFFYRRSRVREFGAVNDVCVSTILRSQKQGQKTRFHLNEAFHIYWGDMRIDHLVTIPEYHKRCRNEFAALCAFLYKT